MPFAWNGEWLSTLVLRRDTIHFEKEGKQHGLTEQRRCYAFVINIHADWRSNRLTVAQYPFHYTAEAPWGIILR